MNDTLTKYTTNKIQDVDAFHILPFFIVALLWGSTDVLIAKASVQKKQDFTPMDFSPIKLIKFVLKKRIWIWMAVNQIGSLLYAYLLGIYPEEYSLIWANCLTVFVAFLLQKLIYFYDQNKEILSQLSKKDPNRFEITRKQIENMIGLGFILIGIYLMII